jgi:hypothetical protein
MQIIDKKYRGLFLTLIGIFLLWGCSSSPSEIMPTFSPDETSPVPPQEATETTMIDPTETTVIEPTDTLITTVEKKMATPTITPPEVNPSSTLADVISVEVSGTENDYRFAVEIRSPDTGCEQYADWWEAVTEDGELIYRRILAHSHVNEQPFTRSGGPAAISADTIVIVRAHMHPDGYGGAAFKGSVQAGFEEIQLEADFAPELEFTDPLPDGCAF